MLLRDILSHAVKLYPDKPALAGGDGVLTYRQADERVRRLAAGLLSLGLKPGDHIAILANNSHRYWETYFVADIAGMPLAPLNIRLAAHELEFILNDGEIKALILGMEFLDLYEGFKEKTPGIEHVILLSGETTDVFVDYERLIEANEPLRRSVREWSEDDLLNLCYTGGTTGLPKGVMLSQRNVVSNATHAVVTFGFSERDTWLHVAPMFHLADAWACYALTMVGGTHAFVPSFSPQGTLEAIEQHRVTKTILVPTMINFLVNFPGTAKYNTTSLDLILFGASPISADRLLAAVRVFGPKFCQAYGMTETSPLLTGMKLDWMRFDGDEKDMKRLASCGRQVAGADVRVVDENGEDVKPGEVGEIIARGPNVMRGYWKRPKETAEALRGGYMHTGDVATIDEENFIYIVDRAKDMIISGGENVYSVEVENALYEHPAVLEAAVIGIPDANWGEAVLAIVVPKEGASVTEHELIEHCHGLIAGYKCPKKVVFQSEPLPKSGPGKILKTELRKPFWEGRERKVN